ncbi:MAG: exosortase/archaeosortase family protein [Sphingobacteriaceae bacterium]|nr:exosortase/archaeosortase family protein [Sphingobacteriaceae bacterium]
MVKQLKNYVKAAYRGPYRFVYDIGLFMIITYGFHVFWWEFADQIKSVPPIIESANRLAVEVFKASYWINEWVFGLNMTTEPLNVMRFENGKALEVAESCSGLKQFFQIAILFLLFPGSWKHKLWFIPLGFLAIHVTNIVRVVILGLWMAKEIPHWDFAHDWIMRPMYYVVIFGLWYFWNEQFNTAITKQELFR